MLALLKPCPGQRPLLSRANQTKLHIHVSNWALIQVFLLGVNKQWSSPLTGCILSTLSAFCRPHKVQSLTAASKLLLTLSGKGERKWEAAMQSQTSLTPHLGKNSIVQNLLILIGSLVKAPAWALSANSKYKKSTTSPGVKHKPMWPCLPSLAPNPFHFPSTELKSWKIHIHHKAKSNIP